jgi:prepilin-type N-terminal cleavage/methylation domain-containing protein
MLSRRRFRTGSNGFTLIEVIVAAGLIAVGAAGLAHLTAIGIAASRAAREQTLTALLAASKLEQLRSLTWSYAPGAADPPTARSDYTTDLSQEPAAQGGPGLAASPAGTLRTNVPPYVDYLDAMGRWVGGGSSPPARAAFVRRWSVQVLPEDPSRTLILSVLVATIASDRSRVGTWTARSGTETLLVTLHTRKGK